LFVVCIRVAEQNVVLDLPSSSQQAVDAQAQIRDADVQLTDEGRAQAAATGKYLAGASKFDYCYASPYRRTLDTAAVIIDQLPAGVKIRVDNRLREKEFGPWHGLDAKAVEKRFPGEYQRRLRDGPYWFAVAGGENYPAVELRLSSFIDTICRDCAGKDVLVVTHQIPYKLFRSIFQHLDEAAVLGLPRTPNCGVQELMLSRSKSPGGRLKLKLFDLVAPTADDNNSHDAANAVAPAALEMAAAAPLGRLQYPDAPANLVAFSFGQGVPKSSGAGAPANAPAVTDFQFPPGRALLIRIALEAIKLLDSADARWVLFGLEILSDCCEINLALPTLQFAEAEVLEAIEEAGGLDKIEECQRHANEEVYECAVRLLERYYAADEDYEFSGASVSGRQGPPDPQAVVEHLGELLTSFVDRVASAEHTYATLREVCEQLADAREELLVPRTKSANKK
jgi:broad specificity phosphatase PhoE